MVDVRCDVEVHAATYVLYNETVAAWLCTAEVDVPHVGTNQGLLASLLFSVSSVFPELHDACTLLFLGLYIV